MTRLLYYPTLFFIVLFVQHFIIYLFSKKRSSSLLIKNIASIILSSVILGIIAYLVVNYLRVKNNILYYALFSISIYCYWFIINPLLSVIFSKKHLRDFEIENQLKNENLKFKVYFTDKINSNALATGIIPFYKIIIIAKNLKQSLNEQELKAIIYHEIGHHKKKHILIMYILNVIFLTMYFLGRSLMVDYNFETKFLEGLSVFLSGAMFGLVSYYIPNKILYFLEYEADSFSAIENNKENMISALISLDKITEGKLTKGNINHPNLEKRITNLQNLNIDKKTNHNNGYK